MIFQLRLWLTVALIVAAGVFVFLLGTTALSDVVMPPFEASAAQSINSVRALFRVNAADAVDAATRCSVDDAVHKLAVKGGPMTPEAEAALLARAGGAAPSFALVLKPDATLLSRAGAAAELDFPLTGIPFIAEAKAGWARDGAMDVDGVLHHVATAPIFEGADVVGLVMLGWPYDAAFAETLSKEAGAPAVLLRASTRVGAALPEMTADQLRAQSSAFGELDLGPLQSFAGHLPLLLEGRGRYALTVLPLLGKESDFDVVVVTDQNKPLRALAYAQAMVIGGTILLALFQTMIILFTMRSVRKPIDVIMNHLSQYQQTSNVGILPEALLSGPFVRLGKQINMILQMMPSSARPAQPLGPIGGLLGSTLPPGSSGAFPTLPSSSPGAPGSPSRDKDSGPTRASTPFSSPPAPADVGALLPSAPANALSNPGAPGLASLFDDSAPDPLAAFRVPSSGPASLPPLAAGELQPEATVMFTVPKELIAQSAQISNAPNHARNDDDARTVVAQVPQELLSQVTPKQDVNASEEAHYREVYDKFVETRTACGEDTSDLTYERFVSKLLKNRQQIVEKHKAKSVRFQVYTKDGKAALRALPVREP